MKEYLHFLRREAQEFRARLVIVAVAAGLFNALLIAFVIRASAAVIARQPDFHYFLLILLSLGGFFFCKKYTLDKTSEMVEGVLARVRLRLAEKIRRTRLEVIEEIGPGQLYTAIAKHTQNISQAFTLLVGTATSAFIILFASLYVISLSVTAFVLIAVMLASLVFYYSLTHKMASANYLQCARNENEYFEAFNDLLIGFKELKMNARKSEEFFETKLRRLTETTQKLKVTTLKAINQCSVLAQCSIFVLLGSVLFLLPVFAPLDMPNIPAIVAVVLFIFGPISEIISTYQFLTEATVSMRLIFQLEARLDEHLKSQPREDVLAPESAPVFESIGCDQVTFSYFNGGAEPGFTLGPIDFQVRAGEIVFVVGGNGSGKSTLLKVLTGLYTPKSGQIRLNGQPLGPVQMATFRSLFAPIFSDYHLFDCLYGVSEVSAIQADRLLALMGLAQKTQIIERRITNRRLSTGQRKRLALVVALLEDRPICLFDEWAADQDPEFRRYFYEELLGQLKAEGKTVIAATHDDRFFSVADRVLKLEYGRFVPLKSAD